MSVFDVIIVCRLSTDGYLVTYLCEKGCIGTLLNNLDKISMAEVVIVVNMVSRMIQVPVLISYLLVNIQLTPGCSVMIFYLFFSNQSKSLPSFTPPCQNWRVIRSSPN